MSASRLDAIQRLSDLAHGKLPQELHGRLERGTALVLHEMIEPNADGSYRVMNTAGTKFYSVNGSCDCSDYEHAPEHLCKHVLGVMFHKRLERMLMHDQELTIDPQEVSTDGGAGERANSPVCEGKNGQSPAGVPAEFVVVISGKNFIRFHGLLALAHQRGLQSLRTTFTYNDAELSLAESTAVFPFGTFTEVGDAAPTSVNAKVRLHFRRCAATRAAARALRNALNISMVAVEELAE